MNWTETGNTDPFNANLLVNPLYAQYARYLKTAAIYKCPSDNGLVSAPPSSDSSWVFATLSTTGFADLSRGLLTSTVRSYAMNGYVGCSGVVDSGYGEYLDYTNFQVYAKTSDIRAMTPADLMVFVDVNPNSICWPFFGVDMRQGTNAAFFMYPTALHSGRGLFTFADGHAESVKWADSRTISPGSVAFHNHDQSSPKNPDLSWLQSQATTRR
jgi:prepilin-type processing-associated H-X9-DG protein